MKQKNEDQFLENSSNKTKVAKLEQQLLYNLVFSGKITLKEYFQVVRKRVE